MKVPYSRTRLLASVLLIRLQALGTCPFVANRIQGHPELHSSLHFAPYILARAMLGNGRDCNVVVKTAVHSMNSRVLGIEYISLRTIEKGSYARETSQAALRGYMETSDLLPMEHGKRLPDGH